LARPVQLFASPSLPQVRPDIAQSAGVVKGYEYIAVIFKPTTTRPRFISSLVGSLPSILANLLGLSGLRTVVLERQPSVYHLPRAVALDGEGMRLVQTMRLADEMHAGSAWSARF
jgi:hypothetical protein